MASYTGTLLNSETPELVLLAVLLWFEICFFFELYLVLMCHDGYFQRKVECTYVTCMCIFQFFRTIEVLMLIFDCDRMRNVKQ